ncbi:glycine cleavage system protein GcvH [Actinospica durhamensis]|uniref:Glycine cleavage system H protein n=1 Tax=Actinospica durhamensis TaxID=1508375 RepID=A0A941INI6_9ACTN|nr:glycine cleavage system protein GcvH [Actinospica durhamensis]MBR7834014.1 glycine cleavage system protein GcvH [Actinospica durhamensis]
MTTTPEDLKYTSEHEWVRGTGPVVQVGITDFAQDSLGDIVFVTLPKPGDAITEGEPCGELESTKSVSDIYAPVTGTVTEANAALEANPELVNSEPYGEGWLFKVELGEGVSVDVLLDAAGYTATLGS